MAIAAVLTALTLTACAPAAMASIPSDDYIYHGPVVPLQLQQENELALERDLTISFADPAATRSEVGIEPWLADMTYEVMDRYLIRDLRPAASGEREVDLTLALNSRLINLIEQPPHLTVDGVEQTQWQVGSLTRPATAFPYVSVDGSLLAAEKTMDSVKTADPNQPSHYLERLAFDKSIDGDLRSTALEQLGSLSTVMSFASSETNLLELTFKTEPDDILIVWGPAQAARADRKVRVTSEAGQTCQVVVLVIGEAEPEEVNLQRLATTKEAARMLPSQLKMKSSPSADWVLPYDVRSSAVKGYLLLRQDWQTSSYSTADTLEQQLTSAFLNLLAERRAEIMASDIAVTGEQLFNETIEAQRWIYLPVTLRLEANGSTALTAHYYQERPQQVALDRQAQGLAVQAEADYARVDIVTLDENLAGSSERITLELPASWKALEPVRLDGVERRDFLLVSH